MSPRVIYTLWTKYPNHPLIVNKDNLGCVLQCTQFPGKKTNGYIFQKNCSSIKQRYMKLGDGFRKKVKNKHTCHMFDNIFLGPSKQMKLCPRDYIFPIKQDNIFDYNPLCFISSGLILDYIIMNLFTDSTKKSTQSNQKHYFFQNQG